MTATKSNAPMHSRSRGFTLIELMVVVGIIVLMMALFIAVSSALRSRSEKTQVENTLQILDMALQEWELAADRQMTWGPTGGSMHFDINSTQGGGAQMAAVLQKLRENAASREILARIDAKFLVETTSNNQTRYELRDPWGRRIVPVHPGRVPNTAIDPADAGAIIDPDGTIRVTNVYSSDVNENRLGICQNRRMIFVSRGPDGELGDLQLHLSLNNVNQAQFDLTKDNIYSSPPLLTRP